MQNWSTDTTELKKNSQTHEVWMLEQLINFGLGNEKLNKVDLQENVLLINFDQTKKKYLTFLLAAL